MRISWLDRQKAEMTATLLAAFFGGTCIVAALPTATPGNGAERADPERYRIIVERQPFGDLTPPPQPTRRTPPPRTAPPPPEEPPFVEGLKMTAIFQGSDNVLRVGLVTVPDKPQRRPVVRGRRIVRAPAPAQAQPQKSYYLRVGQTSDDGITLVNADFEEKKALLRQDGDEHWIFMGGGTEPAEEEAVAAAQSQPIPLPTATARRVPPGVIPTAKPQTITREERTNLRRSAVQRVRANDAGNTPRQSPEERRERLQKLNMELIRARGEKGPPLPIPLTPEQDAQLVKEGVLPAQE